MSVGAALPIRWLGVLENSESLRPFSWYDIQKRTRSPAAVRTCMHRAFSRLSLVHISNFQNRTPCHSTIKTHRNGRAVPQSVHLPNIAKYIQVI
jgi:hypothetical protein